MGIWIKRIIIVALVLGSAYAGWSFFKGNGKDAANEVTYEEAEVTRGDVRSFVTATGVIQPWKIVDVKSNVDGRIDRLYVDLGYTVKAGQPIADIDPTNTRTALNQTLYDLEAAQARREQAEASLKQQEIAAEARIASARQSLANAKARLAQAKANRDVQPDLTELAISQAAAQKASAEKSVSQARQTKQQLEQQLAQLRDVTIPLNVRTINTTVEQAEANLLTATAAHNRQRQLFAQGYVPRADLEAAFARMKTQSAEVEQARQRQQTLKRENDLTVKELQARIDAAQASIEEAEARVKQAEATLSLSKRQDVQIEVRNQEYRAAEAAVAQAQAELRGARAELKLVDVRKKEIITARAQIKRVEAQKEQATVNYGFTKILAPRDGVVITKNVEEGTVVPSSRASIGSTNALLQIGDVSRLWVVCDVDETDIAQVKRNQRVDVRVDAYPELKVRGRVIRIDPQAKIEQNVTLIPVTVELDKPDPRFKPGMNATCEFIVKEASDVVTVPNEAVKEKGEGEFYVQILQAGKPVDVPVKLGVAGQDTTEVIEGLQADQKVITRIIQPEAPQTNNPFAGPFGNRNRGRGGSRGGARGGAGGSRGGGGRR